MRTNEQGISPADPVFAFQTRHASEVLGVSCDHLAPHRARDGSDPQIRIRDEKSVALQFRFETAEKLRARQRDRQDFERAEKFQDHLAVLVRSP